MRAAATLLFASPALAAVTPNTLVARQEGESLEVPEGPLPECSAYCFGRWGWPITLCTGQEGLNHLIECFYDECEDEPSRIHAQLAAQQNCEEGMGWPDRTDEDVEYLMPPAPSGSAEDDEDEPSPSSSPSGTASQTQSPSGTESASGSGVPTGGFDVENPGASASASATETPNGARQTAYAGYVGMAAAAVGAIAAL